MLAPTDALLFAPPLALSEPELYDCGPDTETPKSLVFRAGGRVYTCAVAQVREVAPLPPVTRLPGGPPEVIGLINLRGAIITVLDAGILLHRRPIQRPGAMLLVVDLGPRGVGLAVECVTDVRIVRTEEEYLTLDVRDAVARLISPIEDE